MINFSTAIVSDTIHGALILSVFDFIACFFVLYFISLFIRGVTFFDERIAKSEEIKNKKKEQK